MVTSLRLLAENTLIRDIIFSKEVSPLLYQSYLSTDCLKFETRFIFNGKVLNFDESVGLPCPLSNQIVSSLCEFCPKFSPEWAYLHLIHSGISQLALSNMTVADIPLVQILSLLYKLFARCQRITELYFEMVEITSGFVTHCLLPRAEQYTTICLSSCLNVKDVDVTRLLKNCSNLTNLNVSGCMVSDEAFTSVHLPKIQCNDCGNKRHKSLKLTVLNIAGCVKLTTKTIRKIVELSGPSLRCLYLNQCNNIYTTALWYLCGLFKGKEEFFRGNFALETPLSCCCDIDFSVRVTHKTSVGVHEDCNGGVENTDNTIEEATSSNSVQILETNSTSTLLEGTSHNTQEEELEAGDTTDIITGQISELNFDNDEVQINPSPEHQITPTLAPSTDNAPTAANGPSDCTRLFPQQSAHSSDTFEETFRSTWSLCEEQCEFLEAFLHHTADEGAASEQTSSSRVQDVVTDNLEVIIDSCHSFEGYKDSLCLHFDTINKDALASRSNLLKIIEQSYDDVDISGHEMYQEAAKSVIVSARQIVLILDQMIRIKSNQNEDQENCSASSTDLGELSLSLSDEQFLGIIPQFRDKLVHFVSVIGHVQTEIKRNELLRLRLLHSLELEAIQREELVRIRSLHDQLSALHDEHEAIFGGINIVDRDNDGILHAVDEIQNVNNVHISHKYLNDNVDLVPGGSSSGSDVIHDDEVYDENSPELVNLLKSEAKLLLQHARYSHCPSCCPNAYTPQIEELDISDIKYQSEELAVLTLKGFLTVNKGLKRLNMSWACIDNSLMEFVAASCPDLKALSVQQCTQLSTPFLEYFSGHNLMVVDTLGVSWLHDSDILSLVQTGASSLTSLCLAESNITDIGLLHLAKSSKLRSLNLSWCDEVTDTGLSIIISSHSAILETLLIRQCSIGCGTLKAISTCSNLIQLDISTNVEITDELWIPIALGLPLLRELDISWVYGMTDSKLMQLFYHCPGLKKVTTDGHKQITTSIFRRMITTLPSGRSIRSAQYAPRLQFISLQYCNDIDDDELWEIVQQCRGSLTVKNYYGDDIEYSPPSPSSP